MIVSDLSRNVGLAGFEKYNFLREELLALNARAIFCWFLFFVGIEKNALILYKVYLLRTRYVEICRSGYWCSTWVDKPYPTDFRLVVLKVASSIHQKRNHRCLMHREFNSECIRPLRLRLRWNWHTPIGTTSTHFTREWFFNPGCTSIITSTFSM